MGALQPVVHRHAGAQALEQISHTSHHRLIMIFLDASDIVSLLAASLVSGCALASTESGIGTVPVYSSERPSPTETGRRMWRCPFAPRLFRVRARLERLPNVGTRRPAAEHLARAREGVQIVFGGSLLHPCTATLL